MKVLFVCTGNTCRSCMAEAIFNQLSDMENIKAYSAGISVVPGSKTSKNTATLIKSNFNLNISERNAVQLTEEMIRESDLVLTMTAYMRDVLSQKFFQEKNKIYTLNEFIGLSDDIVDPYGGNINIYEETFYMLNRGIELLLDKIKEDSGKLY
ncbi:low molecular weight protein arginine phosphatase [Clostridium sp. JNZ J1-5]